MKLINGVCVCVWGGGGGGGGGYGTCIARYSDVTH